MKRLFFLAIAIGSMQCLYGDVVYTQAVDHFNNTQVLLSQPNFIYLGNFSGRAYERTGVIFSNMKVKFGETLIAQAKEDLLKRASSIGVKLDGSVIMVNTMVEKARSDKYDAVTVTADLIEFFDEKNPPKNKNYKLKFLGLSVGENVKFTQSGKTVYGVIIEIQGRGESADYIVEDQQKKQYKVEASNLDRVDSEKTNSTN